MEGGKHREGFESSFTNFWYKRKEIVFAITDSVGRVSLG